MTQIPEAENLLRQSSGVAIPFSEPRPPQGAKYKLAYVKPSSVNVIGSYASTTCVKSGNPISIDVSVLMPSVCTIVSLLTISVDEDTVYIPGEGLSEPQILP